jgi:hypothetical protein
MEQAYEQEVPETIDQTPSLTRRNWALVILSPSDTGAGRLIDMSMGGLMMEYIALKAPTTEATELEILVSNGEFRLAGLPCQVIWDREASQVFTTPLHMRRSGLKFGALTPSQIAQLEYFIQNYATEQA